MKLDVHCQRKQENNVLSSTANIIRDKTEVEMSTQNLYRGISVERDVGAPHPAARLAPGWSCRIPYLYTNLVVAREPDGVTSLASEHDCMPVPTPTTKFL